MRGRNVGQKAATIALAAGCAALCTSWVVRAQGGGGQAGGAKPLIPLTASSLVLHPELYVGQTVAMTATVEKVLSKTAFSVDQNAKASTKEVLVLAPYLSGTLQLNSYITVVGDVVRFDPADVARRLKDYTLDLPADVIEKFRGQPAVLATSVINPDNSDVAKRVLPPLTPAEEAFRNVMKQVGPTSTALRTAVDGSNAEATKTNTTILKKNFIDAQLFFKDRGTVDATGWAQEAMKFVEATEQAAIAGKWDVAKTSNASLNQMCTTCHTAHRERLDDGTYRVKGK